MQPAAYMLASKRHGTLYVGVTSDLMNRVWQHRNNMVDGFTKQYAVHQLVWFEIHESMRAAIAREKQLKHWNRQWKIGLIESSNPTWNDLWDSIARHGPSPTRG